jgi:hypothetical protein
MIATRNRLYAFMLTVCAAGWAWLSFHFGKSADLQMQLCWIKATTDMPCPACGTTRALDAMMHGRWWEAMLINPFGLPVLLLMIFAPIWIVVDMLCSHNSFYRAFQWTERKLSSRGIAITLLTLVLANWIWNFYKGY